MKATEVPLSLESCCCGREEGHGAGGDVVKDIEQFVPGGQLEKLSVRVAAGEVSGQRDRDNVIGLPVEDKGGLREFRGGRVLAGIVNQTVVKRARAAGRVVENIGPTGIAPGGKLFG